MISADGRDVSIYVRMMITGLMLYRLGIRVTSSAIVIAYDLIRYDHFFC